jgi:lipoprotein-anchoring transpeptidase ErfK/SrfK
VSIIGCLPRRRAGSRRARLPLVALVTGLLIAGPALGGCQAKAGAHAQGEPSASPSVSASPSPAAAHLSMAPAPDAASVAPATPVAVSVDSGALGAVRVSSSNGDLVGGAVSADGMRWVSRGKLAFGATYTVTATLRGGAPQVLGHFSTAPPPGSGQTVHTSSVLGDHHVYGMAMPVILHLDQSLRSKEAKAAFENALTVTSVPPTVGAWGWVNDREVHFRTQTYWASGTKVHVGIDTAGRKLGDLWGRTDLSLDFTVGIARLLHADAVSHTMTVTENGKLVRTIPVSMGKPTRPSSSGVLVAMDKRPSAIFDSSTFGLPITDPEGYRTTVQYVIRLTWGGEFIHSAYWSVRQQGRVNVSHGCINVSPANAIWLYNRIQMGDPVVVTRTGTPVAIGNGWSDWSVPFAAWAARSETGPHPTA